MKKFWLIIVLLFLATGLSYADDSDYQTLRTFMSAQMYGEAYNELMQRELTGLALDAKLKSLKIDLLERTNLKLQKQAKVSPDDAAIFTILADIAFQKGDYDRASMYISTALSNNAKPIANYVFAKILFRKGNISQAFDQMSKVLEAMPDSPIVFNDFQFLYNCKQYGVATAKKITKDCNFLVRATPIAYDGDELEVPVSPFANDPTETDESMDFSDYRSRDDKDYDDNGDVDIGDDLAELSKIDIDSAKKEQPVKKTDNEEKKEVASAKDSDDFDIDDNSFDFDDDSQPKQESLKAEIKEEEEEEKSDEDPELAKIQKADELLASAHAKFKDGDLDTALLNIKELDKLLPNYKDK